MSITQTIVDDVIAEVERADTKFGPQYDIRDGTGSLDRQVTVAVARSQCEEAFTAGQGTWRHVLTEEVCEAFAESDPVRLRAELLQVAAVALRWVDAIEERAVVGP